MHWNVMKCIIDKRYACSLNNTLWYVKFYEILLRLYNFSSEIAPKKLFIICLIFGEKMP